MMLPSGNDAAQSLAIHFGLLLLRERFGNLPTDKKTINQMSKQDDEDSIQYILKIDMLDYLIIEEERLDVIEMALKEFYKEMNIEAAILKLENTNFSSSHGMHHD